MESSQAIVGNKYNVTTGNYAGSVVELVRMVSGTGGVFRNAQGNEIFKALWNVEPVAATKTPAQRLGMKVGDKFVTTGYGLGWFKDEAVLTFTKDDGTTTPGFNGPHRKGGHFVDGFHDIAALKPYIQTQAEQAGLKVGGVYRLTNAIADVFANTMVKLDYDDNSGMPLFEIMEGAQVGEKMYVRLTNITAGNTPRMEKGYKLGDKFEMLESSNFSKGEIVTLRRDDNTDLPEFENDKGRTGYELLKFVKPYVPTPAKLAGLKIGNLYVLKADNGMVGNKGDVVVFDTDDNTELPRFRMRETDERLFTRISNVEAFTPDVRFMSLPHKTFIEVNLPLTEAQKEAIRKLVV